MNDKTTVTTGISRELLKMVAERDDLIKALTQISNTLAEGYYACDPVAPQYAPAWRAFEIANDALKPYSPKVK